MILWPSPASQLQRAPNAAKCLRYTVTSDVNDRNVSIFSHVLPSKKTSISQWVLTAYYRLKCCTARFTEHDE